MQLSKDVFRVQMAETARIVGVNELLDEDSKWAEKVA
jgi:hypothetical protein